MGNVFQLRITLKDIEPDIWRRFVVSDFWTFDKLHKIIQKVMGWEDYHVYEFNVYSNEFGLVDSDALDANPDLKSSKSARLFECLDHVGQKFIYRYDFGDDWEHELVVEKIIEDDRGKKIPFCVEGKRACPKEGCGGVSGYQRFMKMLNTGIDPTGQDPNELKAWLGDWDPERFDIEKINKKLQRHGGFG